ncbi:hypothetical protein IGI04_019418 [Brassica rapa subsp. trilocularis]|uniref:Uncharacterized protein n=1 Tax=Brassica rapa subsp. trilocularis TaxID=1813537 RepID=A0ABQ7MJ51_BRACM|nr:hypothetical protein IGI04_019418 [Brassica rapa subsp. trilocularis]
MYHKPKRIESLVDALDPKKAEILHYLSENDYDGDCDGDEARDLGLDVFQFRGFGISRDIGFNGSQEGFVLHQIEGFGEYPKRRQINESCGFEVNLWARWGARMVRRITSRS